MRTIGRKFRRWVLLALVGGALAVGAAEPAETLKLWPGTAPGDTGQIGPEEITGPKPGDPMPIRRLTNVTEPRIDFYPAPKSANTRAAVVVCPGGGYGILAFDHEGTMVIEWLNRIGVNGVLLKYRVPRREGREMHDAPLQDTQRAMGLVRLKAGEWGIDPDKIGVLGFSAGGHLALVTGTNFDKRTYEAIDGADALSCRPDFLVPVYPAYLVEEGDGGALPPVIRVSATTPPMFLIHAGDDKHSAEGSARVYIALRRLGIPAELHVYAKGGHGFGMFPGRGPVSAWPQRCEDWMRAMGYLGL